MGKLQVIVLLLFLEDNRAVHCCVVIESIQGNGWKIVHMIMNRLLVFTSLLIWIPPQRSWPCSGDCASLNTLFSQRQAHLTRESSLLPAEWSHWQRRVGWLHGCSFWMLYRFKSRKCLNTFTNAKTQCVCSFKCKVFSLVSYKYVIHVYPIAMGNSKKVAKKAAAEKMVAKLQNLSGCPEITWVCRMFLLIWPPW